MKVSRFLRLTRAAVFAAACVGLSAAGHVWMSGRPVPGWAFLLALAGMFAVACMLAGRRRQFPAIAGLMLAGEFGLHLLFTTAQGPAAPVRIDGRTLSPGGLVTAAAPGVAMPVMPGMTMGAMPAMPGMPGGAMASMGGGVSSSSSDGPLMSAAMGHGPWGMVAVHIVAGLLCAWWLHRGEQAVFGRLWWLVCSTAAPLFLLGATPLAVPRARVRARRAPCLDRVGYPRPILHAIVRRGPPLRPASI